MIPPLPEKSEKRSLTSSLKQSKKLASLGVSPEFILGEWMWMANQREDITNKRKALEPLVREIGIDITPDGSGQGTNITIVMPQEIATKYALVEKREVIDVTPKLTKPKK